MTSGPRKAALAAEALLRAGASVLTPRSPVLHAPPLPETAFLVAAAAWADPAAGRADQLTSIFSELRRRDADRMRAFRAARPMRPQGA